MCECPDPVQFIAQVCAAGYGDIHAPRQIHAYADGLAALVLPCADIFPEDEYSVFVEDEKVHIVDAPFIRNDGPGDKPFRPDQEFCLTDFFFAAGA